MRGPPLQPSPPLQGRCTLVGRLGHTKGLYLVYQLDGHPCRALVDTGSTISLVRPGILPGTTGRLTAAWSPTHTKLMTVTREKADMRGRKPLRIQAGNQELMHDFWLANIRDPCIVGLDLLTRWGACIDMVRAPIILGTETMALQSGQELKKGAQDRRSNCQAAAAQQTPPPCVSHPAHTATVILCCHRLSQLHLPSQLLFPQPRQLKQYTTYGSIVATALTQSNATS